MKLFPQSYRLILPAWPKRSRARVERGGASILHLDVMDGHFVQNITIGPPVVESIRQVHARASGRCHLMIEDPDRYAVQFVKAGANSVSVHYEAARHLDGTLSSIREAGAMAGVVLNPATPVSVLEDVLEVVDYVLLMSVNPGFGGQKLIPYVLEKARKLERMCGVTRSWTSRSKSMGVCIRKIWRRWFARGVTGSSQGQLSFTVQTRKPPRGRCGRSHLRQRQ